MTDEDTESKVKWQDFVCRVDVLVAPTYVEKIRRRPDFRRDVCRDNWLLFTRHAIQVLTFHKSIRTGDVGRMGYLLEIWTTQFLGGKMHKYARELMEIQCGMRGEWTDELKRVVRHNWVVDPWNRKGDHYLPQDECMEELI